MSRHFILSVSKKTHIRLKRKAKEFEAPPEENLKATVQRVVRKACHEWLLEKKKK